MKSFLCLLLIFSASTSIVAQNINVGAEVEINQNMSSSPQATWVKGTVTKFDKEGKLYTVKLNNGSVTGIVSENPEKWIRLAQSKPPAPPGPIKTEPIKTGPEKAITNTTSCAPTEQNVKQRIKEGIAFNFRNYEKQSISYTVFKKEVAYKNTSPYFGQVNTLVHPFSVEFTVDLIHEYKQQGQDYTEHKTWKYKRKYVLYTNTKGQCEFGPAATYLAEEIIK